MSSFLGVPIVIHGKPWGNLYVTEKEGGDVTEEDEEAAGVIADWAAIAITNARLYRDMRLRRDELQRANRGLATTTEITLALGGFTDLDRVLVRRGRARSAAGASAEALRPRRFGPSPVNAAVRRASPRAFSRSPCRAAAADRVPRARRPCGATRRRDTRTRSDPSDGAGGSRRRRTRASPSSPRTLLP